MSRIRTASMAYIEITSY